MKNLKRSFLLISFFCLSSSVFAQTHTRKLLVGDEFDALKSEFQQKATEALGDDPVQTWDTLSLYTSRQVVSKTAALEFNKSEVNISATFPQQVLSPQPPTIDLIMPHIIKNCSIFDCCDCGLFSPHCCLCDVAMAAPKAACEISKAILDLAAGAHLGSIEFKDVAAQAVIDPTQLKVDIDGSLSHATLNANIKARGTIEGKADIHLEPLVSVFTACFTLKPVDIPRTPVEITAASPSFENKIETTTSDNGTVLKLSLNKTALKLNFKNSPFLTTLANNPDLFITCPIPAGALSIVGIVDQVFGIDKSIDLDPQNFPPVALSQLAIEIPGIPPVKTKLGPRANALALGVVEIKTPVSGGQ